MFNTVNTLQAIFQRLVEDGFCNLAPSIIVTAKGMPDLSTRVFLRQLHEAFPQLPVLGLFDWNPSGKSNAFNP